jgi:hypothetical protein
MMLEVTKCQISLDEDGLAAIPEALGLVDVIEAQGVVIISQEGGDYVVCVVLACQKKKRRKEEEEAEEEDDVAVVVTWMECKAREKSGGERTIFQISWLGV